MVASIALVFIKQSLVDNCALQCWFHGLCNIVSSFAWDDRAYERE